MRVCTTVICIIFCVMFFGFNSAPPKVPDARQVKKSADAVRAGTKIYLDKCQICHDAQDIDMRKKSYTQMMPMLASMVDMEKLSKKEIDQVAAYVYSVSKK